MAKRIFFDNLEAWIWTCALIWLAFSDPTAGVHFSLCPLRALGVDFCPGCGLGRAVSYALHGQLAASLHCHLLGIPAIVVLASRIVVLARDAVRRYTNRDFHILYQRTSYAQCHAVNADPRRG
jgi:hypothetical protein